LWVAHTHLGGKDMSLKTKKLYARVTEDELKIITKKAKKGGYKNLSEYL
jgi:hypothetical protein